MKKLGFAFLLCAAGMFAGEWTGVVSDSHCGKAHSEASAQAEKCVEGCVKKGGDPVFVTGDQVVKFDTASKEKVKPYYGKKVTITGSLNGDVLSIDNIKGA